MKAMRLSLLVAVVGLMGLTAGGSASVGADAAHEDSMQASYVRICKDRRGMKDRRACGGKDDPRRTVLAFNLP